MGTISGNGTAVSGLGGVAGYGETQLERSDDGSLRIDASAIFEGGLNYFGQWLPAAEIWVNTNGTLSFGAAYAEYPTAANAALAANLIAVFWADVDTRLRGEGVESGLIHVDLDPENDCLTITWDMVGVYRRDTSAPNRFQLQIYDRGNGDFDIVLRYEVVSWTSGTASGDAGARALLLGAGGISVPVLADAAPAQLADLDITAGNTGIPGLWVWRMRDGTALPGLEGDTSTQPTAGPDNLTGSAEGDLIAGGDGNDTISGLDGADTLLGEAGDDRLYGGNGRDSLSGGPGSDLLDGAAAADTLDGGEGNDTLYGGLGADILRGGDGDDRLYGGNDADLLQGEDGADSLWGDAGNDTLDGGRGDDELSGGAGNDSLSGGDGQDLLSGDDGNDILRGEAGNDRLYGGTGPDTLDGGDGDDLLDGGPDTADDLRDVIYGGAGNDLIYGGGGNDSTSGGTGNDTIYGGSGADTLIGNEGDDAVSGGPGSDMIYGGPGGDWINGGFGHDRINGGSGADAFYHLGIADHGSDWIQDYNAAEGDRLIFGQTGATPGQFQVNYAHTADAQGVRSGNADIAEAFVIYRPTGQIIWALVDGAAQTDILIVLDGQTYDLVP
jgi:Ca2+-binding RTX toxin-like protein